jgi:hypothetical protein
MVTHQVDARVKAVKAAIPQAPLDLPRANAGLYELPVRDDPELPTGECADHPIRDARDGLTTHTVVNPAAVDLAPLTSP